MVRLVSLIAVCFVVAYPATPRLARVVGTQVVPPIADPSAVPGIGRCTSDGACTVTDAAGTRPATRLRPSP